jgi:hypothetical protein
MRQIALITLGLTVFLYSSAQKAIVLTVTNPTTENFKDVVVGITDQEKLAKINKMGSTFQVKSGKQTRYFNFV